MISQLRKFLLVAAVLILFALYALQEQPGSIAVDPKAIAALQSPTAIVRAASPTATLTPTAEASPATTVAMETVAATATATIAPPTATATGLYVDGVYTGVDADADWGYVTVEITISNGALTDVAFLNYPSDHGRSVEINEYAMPVLIQEAIEAQSADVDIVSGATYTSRAFMESLDSALQQALR